MTNEQVIAEVLGREINRLQEQLDYAKANLRDIREVHKPVRIPCQHEHKPDEGGIWKVGTGECAAGSWACEVCAAGDDDGCTTYWSARTTLRYLDGLDQDGQAPDDGNPWEVS